MRRGLVHSHFGRRNLNRRRNGFTLVEMLVSVALVMLMMIMFAQVFQIAGSSISKMRGLAENDQRSRIVQTVIKADLDKRTFRWVYPFASGEIVTTPNANIALRRGYLYISENNPNNDLDDVLQLTVASSITIRNTDTSPYVGQASYLAKPSESQPFGFTNQPDVDDGNINPNNTGVSTVAEIVYFVRNGNLYRRQLLLRDQLPIPGSSVQPTDYSPGASNTPLNIFNPNPATPPAATVLYPGSFAAANSTTFWADFDYSAIYTQRTGPIVTGAQFNGTGSIDNSGSYLNAIAFPPNRFGFSPFGAATAGRPKEFVDNVNSSDMKYFLGRFTMQECTDVDFKYPQDKTTSGIIPTDPSAVLSLDVDTKVVITPDNLSDGTRRGDDLLLANVHAFDIQVWDEGTNSFVNIGESSLPNSSDFNRNQRLNLEYGPRNFASNGGETNTALNAVFDTWHPGVTSITTVNDPPFRPVKLQPNHPIYTNFYQGTWLPNQNYNVGDLIYPSVPAAGRPFYFRCVVGPGTSNPTTEPAWPVAEGLIVNDNNLTWQAIDNSAPLRAIQIQVRFLDVATQQMRQLTIVHSLID